MPQQTPIFVISSGRTGSTFLARMIRRHPQLLCVSDLFEPVGDVPYFDRSKELDGAEFFAVMSRPSYEHRTKFWRKKPTSELLFLHEDDDMVSLLLSYTLAFVTDGQPMELYRRLEEETATWGKATMADHTIRFFDWLRDQFGKDLWIERTGGSLPHTRKIIETWPNAKIIHNFRDTRETAISMMTGSFFRLYLELEKDPELGEWDMDYMPPVEEMGAMLNQWILDAVAALDEVPEHQKIDLRYEDILDHPTEALLRFSNFIFDRDTPTAEDHAWAVKEAQSIRRPPLRFPTLPDEEQERLGRAVRKGLSSLGYI